MPSCFICDKHALGHGAQGGVILDDDIIYVGHIHTDPDSTSAYRGYLMVEPRRHVAGLGLLTDDEGARLGVVVNRASAALRSELGAEHVYAFVFGDSVAHLHIHLVPRYPGTPRQFWGTELRRWPEAPTVDPNEMRALCNRLAATAGN